MKMLQKLLVLISIGTIIFFSPKTSAQEPTSPDSSLQDILNGLPGTPLRLQDAVQYGLKNATSVRRAEAAFLAAGGARRHEAGQFDPQLYFNLNYQEQNLPTASFFAGAATLSTQQTTSRTGLHMDLPIGTKLDLSLSTTRLATNSSFAFLNPEYDAFGTFTFRQALLGGFFISARKQLTRSERELEAAEARYNQQVLAVSADVERSYWDLYAAERDFGVQKIVLGRAERFLKETEIRAKVGLVGPIQMASAKTFLAEQQLQFLESQESLDRQSDLLAALIGVRPEAARYLPKDEPPSSFPADSIETLVDYAIKNNLDLQAAQKEIDAAEALARAASWEWLPTVNLVGSLSGNGLGGDPHTVIFGTDTLITSQNGSLYDAVHSAARREFPSWSIGVEVNIPIGFRSGLGDKDRFDAQVLGAEQQYIEQSRSLGNQVRATYRELANAVQRLDAARSGVEAAQEQVRIGLISFQNGRSTAFELVRLGEDFGVAQRRYSAELVRAAKAGATLKQLTSGKYSFK